MYASPMRLFGGIGVAILLCVLGAPAALAQRQYVGMGRATKTLARIIRRDAKHEYREGRVTVTLSSDGVKVLRVHYRLPPQGFFTKAEYVLKMETRRGHVVAVVIEESGSGSEQSLSEAVSGSISESFTIQSARGSWEWSFFDNSASFHTAADGSKQGVKSDAGCPAKTHLSRSLYREMVRAFRGAPMGKPVHFAESALAHCFT